MERIVVVGGWRASQEGIVRGALCGGSGAFGSGIALNLGWARSIMRSAPPRDASGGVGVVTGMPAVRRIRIDLRERSIDESSRTNFRR